MQLDRASQVHRRRLLDDRHQHLQLGELLLRRTRAQPDRRNGEVRTLHPRTGINRRPLVLELDLDGFGGVLARESMDDQEQILESARQRPRNKLDPLIGRALDALHARGGFVQAVRVKPCGVARNARPRLFDGVDVLHASENLCANVRAY